jgi:ketosteroid isomerase-like protein
MSTSTSSSSDRQLIESLQARLQVLEDREEIRTLLNQYVMRPDAKDWAGYAKLYVEDGVMGFDQWGDVVGHEAIEKAVSKEEAYEGLEHLTANIEITLESPDTASAIARLWFAATPKLATPNDNFAFGGIYNFGVVKRQDGWKLKSMRLKTLWSQGKDTQNIFPIDLSSSAAL